VSQYTPATLIERRRDQMFPVLSPEQIAVARGFGGEPRRFQSTAIVFELGQLGAPAYLVLSGSIEVAKRDPLGHTSAITTHGPGELTGEISQLAGGSSLAQGRAGAQGTEAVPSDSAQLRTLVVSTAEIGETWWAGATRPARVPYTSRARLLQTRVYRRFVGANERTAKRKDTRYATYLCLSAPFRTLIGSDGAQWVWMIKDL